MHTVGSLLLLLLAATAGAQRAPSLPDAGPPLLLRLEGTLAPTHEAARGGFTVASLGFLDGRPGERFLAVARARTVGGDQALDGKDVLALLAPFDPNLLVAGPAEIVGRLRTLPAGTSVRIEGLVERGSRTYYLREVRAADAP